MKQNPSFFRRAADFAQDKGFYIILALCAVAIGISGYVLFFTGGSQNDIPQPHTTASSPGELKVPDGGKAPEPVRQPDAPEAGKQPKAPSLPETPRAPDKAEALLRPANKPVNVPVSEKAVALPVGGEMIRAFSGQELVYDDTMADWRVHGGADFACMEGEQVFAMMDGEVSAIYTDEMWGSCVSLRHDGGAVSTYCGLMKTATLKEGMKVKSGDVIGGAGGGIACESAQPMHIHVVLTRDGESVDPMSLFAKES